MNSTRWFLAMLSGVGLLAMAAPKTLSQTPAHGESLFSASESAMYQPAQKAVSVQAALDQFDNALALRDVGRLQAAGVNPADAKRWRRFFRDNPRATVTDLCPVPYLLISEDTASWTCTETATIISEGKPRSFAHVIRFTFARDNGTWTVADRR